MELEGGNVHEDDGRLRGNIGRDYREMGQKNRYDAEGSDGGGAHRDNGSGSGSKIDMFQNEKIISDSMRKKDGLRTQTQTKSKNQYTERSPVQDHQQGRPEPSRNHKKLANIISTELSSKYLGGVDPTQDLSMADNDGLEEPCENDEEINSYADNSQSFNRNPHLIDQPRHPQEIESIGSNFQNHLNQNILINKTPDHDQVDNIIREYSNQKQGKGQTYDMFSNH